MLYESFVHLDENYKVPDPNPDYEKMLGGHCMVLTGYDDDKQVFCAANSWGTGWGIDGFHYMSYKYICDPNLSSDFWVCESLTKDI